MVHPAHLALPSGAGDCWHVRLHGRSLALCWLIGVLKAFVCV